MIDFDIIKDLICGGLDRHESATAQMLVGDVGGRCGDAEFVGGVAGENTAESSLEEMTGIAAVTEAVGEQCVGEELNGGCGAVDTNGEGHDELLLCGATEC